MDTGVIVGIVAAVVFIGLVIYGVNRIIKSNEAAREEDRADSAWWADYRAKQGLVDEPRPVTGTVPGVTQRATETSDDAPYRIHRRAAGSDVYLSDVDPEDDDRYTRVNEQKFDDDGGVAVAGSVVSTLPLVGAVVANEYRESPSDTTPAPVVGESDGSHRDVGVVRDLDSGHSVGSDNVYTPTATSEPTPSHSLSESSSGSSSYSSPGSDSYSAPSSSSDSGSSSSYSSDTSISSVSSDAGSSGSGW